MKCDTINFRTTCRDNPSNRCRPSNDLVTDIIIARAAPLEKQTDFCVLQKLLTENQYVCGVDVILRAEQKASTLLKNCYRKLFNHLYMKNINIFISYTVQRSTMSGAAVQKERVNVNFSISMSQHLLHAHKHFNCPLIMNHKTLLIHRSKMWRSSSPSCSFIYL